MSDILCLVTPGSTCVVFYDVDKPDNDEAEQEQVDNSSRAAFTGVLFYVRGVCESSRGRS